MDIQRIMQKMMTEGVGRLYQKLSQPVEIKYSTILFIPRMFMH